MMCGEVGVTEENLRFLQSQPEQKESVLGNSDNLLYSFGERL